MRVYNLSDANHALLNISLRRLKVSRAQDLNDPFELLHFNLKDKRIRKLLQEEKERIHGEFGVLCFSQNWSNPVLWSHYGDKHRGICLGFDVPDDLLVPINYVSQLSKIPLKAGISRTELSQLLNDQFFRTKFEDWRYENEVRAFVGLDHSTVEAGLYFTDFTDQLQLREVIVGPRCDIPLQRVVDLVASFSAPVHVVKARIAFTKFSVVEDRRFRRAKA
jgi:hypothetical protein